MFQRMTVCMVPCLISFDCTSKVCFEFGIVFNQLVPTSSNVLHVLCSFIGIFKYYGVDNTTKH